MKGSNRVFYNPNEEIVNEYPKTKTRVEIQDGKFGLIEETDPFEGISFEHASLKSCLKNGVKMEQIGARRLEKAYGADKVTEQVNKVIKESKEK